MSDVSIVIPAYKAANTIPRALASLKAEKNCDLEIIVVEDGVFDGTADEVAKFDNIRHLRYEENGGVCKARNRGLMTATAPYVLFLDADDYIEGSFFDGVLTAFKKYGADLVLAPYRVAKSTEAGDESSPVQYLKATHGDDFLIQWLALAPGTLATPGRVLWRRDSLLEIGGWNAGVVKGEDRELLLRGIVSGLTLAVSSQGSLVYWKDVDNEGRSANNRGKSEVLEHLFNMIEAYLEKKQFADAYRYYDAMGRRSYQQAYRDYCGGFDVQAQRWSQRARRYGFKGHLGSPIHRAVSAAIGLHNKTLVSRKLNIWKSKLLD